MNRSVLVSGLVIGAAGIALLWAAGTPFPTAVPPGIVILLIGAVLVLAARARWADAVGAFLGLFVLVGFVVSGVAGDGFDSVKGDYGALGVVGQIVQLVGVGTALVVGVALAARGKTT